MVATILWITLLAVFAIPGQGQVTDLSARDAVRTAIRAQAQLRSDQFLDVNRDENLERLFAVAVRRPTGSVLIYRASGTGDEPGEGTVTYHISTDVDLRFIAAVGSRDGRIYRVHGFPDSLQEYAKLMLAVNTRVLSAGQAESVADFYREVNPESLPIAPVSNLLALKQSAERACVVRATTFDVGQVAFSDWWRRNRREIDRVRFGQSVAVRGTSYLVAWIVLSSASKNDCGGAPLRAEIEVARDGRVGRAAFLPIWQ